MKQKSHIDCENSARIINLPSPQNSGDAVNKAYADGLITGGGAANNTISTTVSNTINSGVNYLTTLAMSTRYILTSVSCSIPMRFRFYLNSTYRTSDLSRSVGVFPSGDTGLVFEGITAANMPIIHITPSLVGVCDDINVPITITNLGNSSIIGVTFGVNYISF